VFSDKDDLTSRGDETGKKVQTSCIYKIVIGGYDVRNAKKEREGRTVKILSVKV